MCADNGLQIEYTEALPLREFYEIIDEHFERRQDLDRFSESLNRAAHQFRVVEKRLLSRFRDRNPSPLDKLDVVSEETYLRLVQLGEQVESAQERLDVSAKDLRCAAGLVALLARYRFQLSSKDHALLLAHLCPNVADTDDQVRQTLGHGRAVLVMSHSRAFVCAPPEVVTTAFDVHTVATNCLLDSVLFRMIIAINQCIPSFWMASIAWNMIQRFNVSDGGLWAMTV